MRVSMSNRHCPMARAMGEIGDGWTILVLWATLNGVTRFDAMQQRLGLARNILADRLRRLTEAGLIERRPVAEGGKRCEYLPTAKALPLMEPLALIRMWGLAHARPLTPEQRPSEEPLRLACDGPCGSEGSCGFCRPHPLN